MSLLGEIGDVVEIKRGTDVFSFEWRIPDFLSLAGEGGDYYLSPNFDFCDGEWCFSINPNGLSQNPPSEKMSLLLCRLDEGPPKSLSLTLGIKVPDGVENKRERIQEFSKYDNVCFWFKFCSRSDLRQQKSRLMPRNILIIILYIKIDVSSSVRDSSTQATEESKERKAPTEEHLSSKMQGVEELQKSLHGLLTGGEDSDILIKVLDKEFPAHRAILRARSTVFQVVFSQDMLEKQKGVVIMEDCDPESFPAFLEHVYTGSVEMISMGNVFSLYTVSDKYDLNMLKKACMEFMKNNLNISCICNAFTLAVEHGEKELLECAIEFFCNNTLEICKTVEWLIFLKKNTTVGNELLIKAFSPK